MSTTAQVAVRFNAVAERPSPQPIQKLLLHHDHEDVLSHIYICITFQWRVTKLTALRQVLGTLSEYPVAKEICIATDKPSRLAMEIGRHLRISISEEEPGLCGCAGKFSAFMHLEHDVEVTWAALQEWAADSALLEPLGFLRGFVRTEIAPWSGRAMAADAEAPVNLTGYDKWVRVTDARNASRFFLQLPTPASGAWVASAAHRLISWRLTTHRRSIQWEGSEALADQGIFIEPPPWGFNSSALVPYDPVRALLLDGVQIQRVSNEVCMQWEMGDEEYRNKQPPKTLAAQKCTIDFDRLIVT
ncbi:g11200 [Coccomyxa elongata]